ncbi:hypothetical protein BDZ90DRAFT_232598 [Jaminaea rosea]|uniref:DUF7137 domain-containing protein n=1 Tax=Jaminaea rosea TaxID=1569628 RepID=A0A316URS4_9BASI|nr:hypothetical protein BDZ90DRAFT_232598 [Jaminaea rosea]PWN27021.1 hypothetical protein BDZ90DRAFT_232598 [Jaminaea rosea]
MMTPCQLPTLFLLLCTALAFTPALAQAADPIIQPTTTTAAQNGNNGGNTASTTGVSIPSSAPAGGITITQPVQTAEASYYKIAPGVDVTFAWNFTSILSYPTSLTLQAYCTSNKNTYPIATLPGTATQAIWNPYSYSMTAAASNLPALVQETYRLQVMDERGLGVGASPGVFQPNQKVQFALYIPQAYTPLSAGWICASCKSGAGLGYMPQPLVVGLVATLLAVGLSGWNILGRAL